jgi:hypothetical protein
MGPGANSFAGLQVVCRPHSHFRLVCLPPRYKAISAHIEQGRELQFNHGTERVWKIEHPRLDMLRTRYKQLERGAGAESPGE